MPVNWICVQDGAREHYAIARALHQANRLELLFTEIWAGPLLRRLARGPFRPLAIRYHSDLAGARVIHWTGTMVWQEVLSRTIAKNKTSETNNGYDRFIQEGERFSRQVQSFLERQGTDVQGKIIFSYDTTALELFQWAKERGAICVLGQMDPARSETVIVSEENARWPGWSLHDDVVPEAYHHRRKQEWELADYIVVNSQWSANALAEQGVPPQKLQIIPLCYEEKSEVLEIEKHQSVNGASASPFSASSPLRVLFLGQVILRKGIQYLIEAAKLLQDEFVHFDVVGPVFISDQAVKSAPPNVTFHGRANRNETSGWYKKSDAFILPTISDGFAITQIEAMANGLPVIATPNCGAVVTDALDGFIVPAGDALALAEAIRRYLAKPELLTVQSRAAIAKSRQFSLENLISDLSNLEYTMSQNIQSQSR